jgi:hypothetical protein
LCAATAAIWDASTYLQNSCVMNASLKYMICSAAHLACKFGRIIAGQKTVAM